MSVAKGQAGYLNAQKKIQIIKVVIAFALVATVFLAGYLTTGTRMNLMTVVAVLGCLPAAKMLVDLIVRFPYKSISKEMQEEIDAKAKHLVVAYDMVVTSEKEIMPINSIVVYGNTVCGFTLNEKVDCNYAAKHIKTILEQNKFEGLTVKIFDTYKAFLFRAEALESIAEVEKEESKEREEMIRDVILCISL